MAKRSKFFLIVMVLVISIMIGGGPLYRLMAAFPFAADVDSVPVAADVSKGSSPAISLDLRVDEVRLMAHIDAIAQPRHTPTQKAAARRYIITQLIDYGLIPIEQPYAQADLTGTNIVVTIPGADPLAETIVLSAHYDTVEDSPGADDNGSAIATLLEAARIFSPEAQRSQPDAVKLPNTLKLVFFDQEEQQSDGSGLLGSLAFTNSAENMAGVKGAVILDMVGYACHTPGCQRYPMNLPLSNLPETGDFLLAVGQSTHTDLMDAFVQSEQTNEPLVLSLPVPQATLRLFPDLLRSDHAPFWNKSIPAVFVTDTANFRNPNYHSAQDTRDTLDLPFFKGSAQHVVNAVATLLQKSST
ncbi:MAG: peptidase M28 [Phormidesmis priestleyi]|uniref:Peptidase M28 n=1 Tax=Phormidesmis priestleyi TaxID=268141 RepID=A0A2W4Z9P7_9CYAN|nr:MAG: peptidase M28 [Phormidesmis priestleyi]